MISKVPNNLVNLYDENNIKYINYIFKLIENIILNCEENKNYNNLIYANKLILVFFCYCYCLLLSLLDEEKNEFILLLFSFFCYFQKKRLLLLLFFLPK